MLRALRRLRLALHRENPTSGLQKTWWCSVPASPQGCLEISRTIHLFSVCNEILRLDQPLTARCRNEQCTISLYRHLWILYIHLWSTSGKFPNVLSFSSISKSIWVLVGVIWGESDCLQCAAAVTVLLTPLADIFDRWFRIVVSLHSELGTSIWLFSRIGIPVRFSIDSPCLFRRRYNQLQISFPVLEEQKPVSSIIYFSDRSTTTKLFSLKLKDFGLSFITLKFSGTGIIGELVAHRRYTLHRPER